MGCSGAPEVFEEEKKINSFLSSDIIEKNSIYELSEDLIPFLYLKINKLILDNPFYKIPLLEFETTLNNIKKKTINNKKFDRDNIINEIISKYLENQEIFIKMLFINIVNHAHLKLSSILDDNEDLMILIILFLYIFLSNRQPGKKNLFKDKIKILLNKTKKQLNNDNKYNISIINNLLINFIQMFSFSFASFFVFFTFLDNFEGYDKNKINQIITAYNNKNAINDVYNIINYNLKTINNNYSTHYLNLLIISEFNNKIKYIFEKVGKKEEFIILDDYEINIISEALFDSININNFVEYLFFGENHDY